MQSGESAVRLDARMWPRPSDKAYGPGDAMCSQVNLLYDLTPECGRPSAKAYGLGDAMCSQVNLLYDLVMIPLTRLI